MKEAIISPLSLKIGPLRISTVVSTPPITQGLHQHFIQLPAQHHHQTKMFHAKKVQGNLIDSNYSHL